jgi:hypothetical protein
VPFPRHTSSFLLVQRSISMPPLSTFQLSRFWVLGQLQLTRKSAQSREPPKECAENMEPSPKTRQSRKEAHLSPQGYIRFQIERGWSV